MANGNWRDDLHRAMDTDLADLLRDDGDPASLGIGLLAWIARAKDGGLLRPGGIGPLAVHVTGGVPTEFDVAEIAFDGKLMGPWVAMLCPAGHTDELFPWHAAVADRPGKPDRSRWLRDSGASEPAPDEVLAGHADLLRIGYASLGAAMRPVMAEVAKRQGIAAGCIFGVSLASTITTAMRQGADCISVQCSGVHDDGHNFGDWAFQFSTQRHLGLSQEDVTRRADNSTVEGTRAVERMLTDDTVLTSVSMTFEGDDLVKVATMGRPR